MRGSFLWSLSFVFVFQSLINLYAAQVTDEELYKKAVAIEGAIKEMEIHLEKLHIELTLMRDVLKGLPTRLPASEIPMNTKGKPVVVIEKFKESMKKLRHQELQVKIKEHNEEVDEREKTLARLKKERDEIFQIIKMRVRNMR